MDDREPEFIPLDVAMQLESRGSVTLQRTRDFRIDEIHTGGNSRMNLCRLDYERVDRILNHRARVQREMNG